MGCSTSTSVTNTNEPRDIENFGYGDIDSDISKENNYAIQSTVELARKELISQKIHNVAPNADSTVDNLSQIPAVVVSESDNKFLHDTIVIPENNITFDKKSVLTGSSIAKISKIVEIENATVITQQNLDQNKVNIAELVSSVIETGPTNLSRNTNDNDIVTSIITVETAKDDDRNDSQSTESNINNNKIDESKLDEDVKREDEQKYNRSEFLESKSKALFLLQTTSELCATALAHNDWDGISPEVADCFCEVLELLRNKNVDLYSEILEVSNSLRVNLFQHIKIDSRKKRYIPPIFNIPNNSTVPMIWLPRVSTLNNDSYTEIGSLFDLGLSNRICEKSGVCIEFWIRHHVDKALFYEEKKEEMKTSISSVNIEGEIEKSFLEYMMNINQTLLTIERYGNESNAGLGIGLPFDDNIPSPSLLFHNQTSSSSFKKLSSTFSNTSLLSLPVVAIGPVLSPLLSIIGNKLVLTLDQSSTIPPSPPASNLSSPTVSVRGGGTGTPTRRHVDELPDVIIPINQWVHISLIYQDGVVQVLKNGKVAISQSTSSIPKDSDIVTEDERIEFVPEHSKLFLGPTHVNQMHSKAKRSHSRTKSVVIVKPKATIEICEFRLWAKSFTEAEIIRNLPRSVSPVLAVADPFLRLSWMPTRYDGTVLKTDQGGYADRGKGSLLFDVWEQRPLMGRHGDLVHSGEVESRWPSVLPPLVLDNLPCDHNDLISLIVPSYEKEREEEMELQAISQLNKIRNLPDIVCHPLTDHAKTVTKAFLSQYLKENKIGKTACWLPRIVRILGGQRVYIGMSDSLGLTTVNGFTIELWLRIGLDESSRGGGVGSGTVGVRRGSSSIGSEESRSEHLIVSSYVSYGSKSTESLKILIRDCYPIMSFGDTDMELRSPHRIGNNMWTHLAFSFRGKNKRIYVDGRLAAEAGSRQLVGSCALYLGGQFSSRFDVCEMRVWSRGLSRKEVGAYRKAVISPIGYEPATTTETQGILESIDTTASSLQGNMTTSEIAAIQISDDTDLRLSWFPLRYGGPSSHKLWAHQVATERLLSLRSFGHSLHDTIFMKDCDSYPCPTLFWDRFRNRDIGRIECLQSLGNPLFTTRFSLQAVPCFLQSVKSRVNRTFLNTIAVIDEWSDAFDYCFMPSILMDDIFFGNQENSLNFKNKLILESYVVANFDSNHSEIQFSDLIGSSQLDDKGAHTSEFNGTISVAEVNSSTNSIPSSYVWIPRVWFVTMSSSLLTSASSLFNLGNLSTIGLLGELPSPERYSSFTVDLWVRRNSSSMKTNSRPFSANLNQNSTSNTPPLPSDYDITCFLNTSQEIRRDSISGSNGSVASNSSNSRVSMREPIFSEDEEGGLCLGLIDGRPFLSFTGHRGDRLISDSLDSQIIATTATSSASSLVSLRPVAKGRWTHIAFVFVKEGNASIYIDGDLDCSRMIGYQRGALKEVIHGFSSSAKDSWGMVCEMRLWNCALSPSEVKTNRVIIHHPLTITKSVKEVHPPPDYMKKLRLCWMPLLTENTLFWDCMLQLPIGKCKEVPFCSRSPYYLPPPILNHIEEIPHMHSLDNRQDTFECTIMPTLSDKSWKVAPVPSKKTENLTMSSPRNTTRTVTSTSTGGKRKPIRSSIDPDDAILSQMTASKQKFI